MRKLTHIFLYLTLILFDRSQGVEDCSRSAAFPQFFGVDDMSGYSAESQKLVTFTDLFYFEKIEYIIVATNDKIDPATANYGSYD